VLKTSRLDEQPAWIMEEKYQQDHAMEEKKS
jgi:hypothetical protein